MSTLADMLFGKVPQPQALTAKEKHKIAEEAQIRATDRRYMDQLSRDKWRAYSRIQERLGVCRVAVVKRMRRLESMGMVERLYVQRKNYRVVYYRMTKEGKKYYSSLQLNGD